MQNFILLASLKQSSFDFYDIIPSCFVVFGFSAQLSGYFLSFFAIFFFSVPVSAPQSSAFSSHLIWSSWEFLIYPDDHLQFQSLPHL